MTSIRRLLVILLMCASSGITAQTQFDVFEASIDEIRSALEQGRASSVQLVQQYLDRIQAYDRQGPGLNSIVRLNADALDIARALDEERRRCPGKFCA